MRCSWGESEANEGSAFGGFEILSTTRATALGSMSDSLDVFDEISGLDLLEDVAGRTGHHARIQSIVVGEAGEHQTGEVGAGRTQLPADLDTASVLKADVQDRDVGFRQRDPRQGIGGGGGLSHDLEVRIAHQEAPDALTHELVVVEEKDSDRPRSIVPARYTPRTAAVVR
jgi:hypothetical protein